MSCYEWERGTIKLPAKEWAGFRKGLLEAWNKHQLELLAKAQRAHKAIKDALKGKRGKARDEAMKAAIQRHVGDVHREANEALVNLVLTYDRDKRAFALKATAPKKKDLKLFAVSKDAEIYLPDAYVRFVNKTRSVVWDVPENNRARQHARDHWFARLLFAKLGRITWTRGTGGQIIGNDEYNRDRDDVGGGGNYLVTEYKPLTAKEKKAQARQRSSYVAGGYGRMPRY